MIRLHWTRKGVPTSLTTSRGAMRASVFPRRDGMWSWFVGRCRTPQDTHGGLVFVRAPWTRGVARTRRDAQRACLRWVRAWHRGARVAEGGTVTRVRDHVEPVVLHPVTAPELTPEERAAFLASLRAEECPTCEGRGGVQRDEWGYELDPCTTCRGSGLREASP